MRIIHKISPGCPWMNPIKCGDNPVGSLISGMFGLAGTEATNESNEDIADWQLAVQMAENQKNRDYNTAEAEKARNFEAEQAQIGRDFTTQEREAQQQWQQSQWEYQQKNQLPLQMLGARAAGVNPNVAAAKMMSAQGGSVSAPSGASSPMPGAPVASYSGGLSPVPFQAINPAIAFAQAAQGLASLATAKEKGANVSLIEKQVQNMAVDTQYKQTLIEGLRLANSLSKIKLSYSDRREAAELAETVARTATIKTEGELHAATIKIQDSIRRLNESLVKKHDWESKLLAAELGAFDKKLQSQLQLQGAQIKEATARAYEAGESARLHKAQAATVDALRPYQKTIERAKSYVEQSSAPHLIAKAEQEVVKSKWFNDVLKNKSISIAIENTDKRVYNALQRIMRGRSVDGDVLTVIKGLEELGEGAEFYSQSGTLR